MYFADLSATTGTGAHVNNVKHGFLSRWQPRIILQKVNVDPKLISKFFKSRNYAKLHRLTDKRRVVRSTAKKLSKIRRKRSSSLVMSIPLSDSLRARLCSGEPRAAAEVERRGREAPDIRPSQEVVNFGRESILEDGSSQSNPSPMVTCQNELIILPIPQLRQGYKPLGVKAKRRDKAGCREPGRSIVDAEDITYTQSELSDVVTVDQGGHAVESSEDEQVDMVKRRKKRLAAAMSGQEQPSERSKSKVRVGGGDRVLTL